MIFCECVKVGATFTPVPQGCRAGKAQLVIKSLGAVSLAGQSQNAASPGCGHCGQVEHKRPADRLHPQTQNTTLNMANTVCWTP